mgnify:CR=1 FL=1
METLNDYVSEYVACLYRPANGLGVHITKAGYASHVFLGIMHKKFGRIEVDKELEKAFSLKE